MQSTRLQNTLKALLLIALGLFLYSRIANGTLFYYINERFMGFTIVAVFGLLIVGLSYRYSNAQTNAPQDHAGHSHAISWRGALIVVLPIALGILTPPQPLGVAALANREMDLGMNNANQSLASNSAVVRPREKASVDKNILDWWRDFRTLPNANQALAGQEVKVTGFVYKDDRYGEDIFILIRFTVSCCVADASVVGMLVQSSAHQSLQDDMWVEVTGTFVASQLENWTLPIVAAQQITQIDVPSQPYLYP